MLVRFRPGSSGPSTLEADAAEKLPVRTRLVTSTKFPVGLPKLKVRALPPFFVALIALDRRRLEEGPCMAFAIP